MRNVRLDGLFVLKSPLSHIGETISNTSYLVEETVLQDDGTTEKVFAYSGNAWRGQLRDLMAGYMLDKLGRPQLSLEAFHLLFSGGRIGGPQSTDMEAARRYRATIPMLALLGGGVGNQILQGKLRVGSCYPLCREALPVLPSDLHDLAGRVSYSDVTMTKEYSRRDDAKIASVAQYLAAPDVVQLLPGGEGKGKKRSDDGPADQMRIRSELVTPGVRLRTWIVATDVTDVELGCLVSGMHRFGMAPFIGGQSARGHGEVALEYRITDLDTGESEPFLRAGGDETCRLAPPAERAKEAYDAHLRAMYDAMLENSKAEIAGMLGAAA